MKKTLGVVILRQACLACLVCLTCLVCLACLCLMGCTKIYKGTDELIGKAREVIPVSDAATIDIQYAGMCGIDDRAIVWFISGNEYQAHYYLPMEIELRGTSAEYAYIRTYKPMTGRAADVAVLLWNRGYAFVINNPDVATVRIVEGDGSVVLETVREGSIPYVFYHPSIPTEYCFFDAEGNEVPAT